MTLFEPIIGHFSSNQLLRLGIRSCRRGLLLVGLQKGIHVFISGVKHFLLKRLWLGLDIQANWNVSFSCSFVKVSQTVRALYILVKRAPRQHRLGLPSSFAWNCLVAVFNAIGLQILYIFFLAFFTFQIF